MKSALLALLFLLSPCLAHAAFLDCLYFDGFDGDITDAPAAWQGDLRIHDCARKTVDPPADPPLANLNWNAGIAQTAQTYANQCMYQHSGNPDYGENIYAATPWSPSAPTDAAAAWASEYANYDYASNTCATGQQCGHYTQMVWRDTAKIGCGVANCSSNSPFGAAHPQWTFVVCNYDPPGNYVGERPY